MPLYLFMKFVIIFYHEFVFLNWAILPKSIYRVLSATVFHCRITTLYHFDRGFNVCKHYYVPPCQPQIWKMLVKSANFFFFFFFLVIFFTTCRSSSLIFSLFRLKVMLKTFFLCKVGVRQTVLSKCIDIISHEKKLSD